MYEYLDARLEAAKKKLRREFNRLGLMGFDELNVVNTKKVTQEMFDRFLATNEKLYLDVGKKAYKKAVKTARDEGFSGDGEDLDGDWLFTILFAYNLVTGYLYEKEAERKRLRLVEQILTAREYDDRQMFNTSLRKSANLWWTQTAQYGIDAVDLATLKGFEDMGVEKVRWVAEVDGRTCPVCKERNNKIYKVSEVPKKTHYQCRCYLVPVTDEE